MPNIEVKVSISVDGRFVPGFDPYIRRIEVDEVMSNKFGTPGDQDLFVDIPGSSGQVYGVKVIAATNDTSEVLYRRGSDTSGLGIPINAGGCLVLVDVGIPVADGNLEYNDQELSNSVTWIQGGR